MALPNAVLFAGESLLDPLLAQQELLVFLVICLLGFLAIVARFELVHSATRSGESGEVKVNCPECGARTTVESYECDYCGEPLDR